MKIETPRDNQRAFDQLRVDEVLGFDCITGVDMSYFDIGKEGFIELFPTTYCKLNSNFLCSTQEDVFEFLEAYNRKLSEGYNLEHGDNPVPALLSIVCL
jgi:hypothetical protein